MKESAARTSAIRSRNTISPPVTAITEVRYAADVPRKTLLFFPGNGFSPFFVDGTAACA